MVFETMLNLKNRKAIKDMAKNKLTSMPLFNMLAKGLRDVKKDALPEKDILAMGFTDKQMARMDLKHPRLIWYDAKTKTFYDQGDSTLIKRKDWYKINEKTFNNNRPMSTLQKYVILSKDTLKEAEHTKAVE